MKHEYHFTLTRTDRICLVAFVVILLGWELVKYVLPAAEPLKLEKTINDRESMEAADGTSDRNVPRRYEYLDGANFSKHPRYEEDENVIVSPVAIMEASVDELKSIGISARVAFNIKKYTAAGGILKNDKDLMKIYGMDSLQLQKASPYIIYPVLVVDSSTTTPYAKKAEWTPSSKKLDLNLVTASDLESLPGIGAVLAERIIKFRDGLGGFFSVDQLKECYGIPPETLEKINPQLLIMTQPKRIPINQIDLTSFRHPYVDKKFLRIIKAYKDHHGPFSNASDLRKVYPPDSTWCDKILPYLEF